VWERLNHQFVTHAGYGQSIKQMSDIPALVTHLLTHGQTLSYLKDNELLLNQKNPAIEIPLLVKQII
jgi:hypothetical protein